MKKPNNGLNLITLELNTSKYTRCHSITVIFILSTYLLYIFSNFVTILLLSRVVDCLSSIKSLRGRITACFVTRVINTGPCLLSSNDL